VVPEAQARLQIDQKLEAAGWVHMATGAGKS